MTLIVGQIEGVCASACRYDTQGVCSRCRSLDPKEYILLRLPSEETTKREEAVAAFSQVAADLGLDPSILQIHRGPQANGGTDG